MKFLSYILVFLQLSQFLNIFIFTHYNIITKKLIFECKTENCQKSIAFYNENDHFLISNKENVYMKLEEDKINISNLNIYGKIHTTDFSSFEKPQWKLFHLNTFDKNDNSWNPSIISTCGNSPDTFLGGPCNFGATEAYTKLTNLPKHEMLNIKMRIHFFDEWNYDSLFLEVDKKTVWAQSHKSCLVEEKCKSGINVCGQQHPDRLSVSVDVEVQHTSYSVNLLIGTTLKSSTDPCSTSWGIDDLIIYYK